MVTAGAWVALIVSVIRHAYSSAARGDSVSGPKRRYARPVDLAYLRANPDLLPTFLKHQRIRETPVGGGSICQASRLTLEDGASVFAKSWPEHSSAKRPDYFFESEARGLHWLWVAGAVPVPEIVAALPDLLALEWIDEGPPSAVAAERFGRELAALHRSGADGFGLPWRGYIGSLPQDNDATEPTWVEWFAARRLTPYLKISADRGALSGADVALVDRLISKLPEYAAEPEPVARLHGDLWPGNLLWGADGRVWLVDPAAHGGHRETDLAQLALFGGAPHLDRILAAYREVWPLADGWQARVPVHQLHLLLVHTALFGTSYAGAVVNAARAALRG
jgi:fructosamine-3-kinase